MRGLRLLNRMLEPLALHLVQIEPASAVISVTPVEEVIDGSVSPDQENLSVLPQDLAAVIPTGIYTSILEVGPKHGHHSRVLAGLNPEELVLVDLARNVDHGYVADLPCQTRLIWGDILTSPEVEGPFDLIVCAGVLYHVVEPFRLLTRLWDVGHPGTLLVLESTLAPESRVSAGQAALELRWRPGRGGNYCFPTRRALWLMLAMTGWTEIKWYKRFRTIDSAILLTAVRGSDRPVTQTGLPFGA